MGIRWMNASGIRVDSTPAIPASYRLPEETRRWFRAAGLQHQNLAERRQDGGVGDQEALLALHRLEIGDLSQPQDPRLEIIVLPHGYIFN
jgi:hypothetical protein